VRERHLLKAMRVTMLFIYIDDEFRYLVLAMFVVCNAGAA
jgi:hypothetical protein